MHKIRHLLLAGILLGPHTLFAQQSSDDHIEVTRVSSKPLKEILFYPEYSAPAKVVSLNNAQLSAQINAQILAINVRVGDLVGKGETLVILDCQDAEFSMASARARFNLARKELARLRKLKKASAITEQNLSSAETDLNLARISLQQSELQVERCLVKAPISGVVTSRQASEGELASVGTPMLTLVDTENVEVVAQISPSDSKSLVDSDKTVFEWSGNSYPLTLRSLSSVINPQNRNREIRFIFKSIEALTGAAGRVRWTSQLAHLPADMLLERDEKIGIFIRDGEKARFVAINGAKAGHAATVDLPDDTYVIIDGRFALNDGDLVENQGI